MNVRDRIGAATGAAYVTLIMIGNMLYTADSSQSSHPTGEQVLRDVEHQASSNAATVGFVLEILGFVAFICFLGYLADMLRRRANGRSNIAAAIAMVASITMLAIKLGSAGPVVALVLDRDHLTPELAQVLNDVNGAAFVVSWLPCGIFVAALALALQRVALIGRPTTYSGVAFGVAGVALAVHGLHDPVNANPIPFLLGLLWVLVVSVRLAVRPAPDVEAAIDSTADARVPTTV
jgi:hypothetical protein